VELVKENRDAKDIYYKVRHQTLDALHIESTMGGSVGYSKPKDINHLAVWAMIDAYGIKDRLGTFDKIIRCWHHIRANEED
jgi:hypothetical protein